MEKAAFPRNVAAARLGRWAATIGQGESAVRVPAPCSVGPWNGRWAVAGAAVMLFLEGVAEAATMTTGPGAGVDWRGRGRRRRRSEAWGRVCVPQPLLMLVML